MSSPERRYHDHRVAGRKTRGRRLDQSGRGRNEREEGNGPDEEKGQSHQDVADDGDDCVKSDFVANLQIHKHETLIIENLKFSFFHQLLAMLSLKLQLLKRRQMNLHILQ